MRLGRILDGMNLHGDVVAVSLMPMGNNEKEMWEILQLEFDGLIGELYNKLTR